MLTISHCLCLALWTISPQAPGLSTAQTEITQSWRSLASFEADVEEFMEAAPEGHKTRLRILYQAPDRWSVTSLEMTGRGQEFELQETQTQGHLHSVTRQPGDPSSPPRVITRNLEGSPHDYACYPNILTSILMPGEAPPISYLTDEAKFTQAGQQNGQPGLALEATFRGNPLLIVFDPDHDWMVREVALGQDLYVRNRVTRFEAVNGHWFPMEGHQERAEPGNDPVRRLFKVVKLSVNEPLPASAFEPPPLVEGAIVDDQTTGKSFIHSREKKPTLPPGAESEIPIPNPVRAGSQRNSVWPRLILSGIGVLVIAIAAGLAIREKWSEH